MKNYNTHPWTVFKSGCFCQPSKEFPWYEINIWNVTLSHLPDLPLAGTLSDSGFSKSLTILAPVCTPYICEKTKKINLE